MNGDGGRLTNCNGGRQGYPPPLLSAGTEGSLWLVPSIRLVGFVQNSNRSWLMQMGSVPCVQRLNGQELIL